MGPFWMFHFEWTNKSINLTIYKNWANKLEFRGWTNNNVSIGNENVIGCPFEMSIKIKG